MLDKLDQIEQRYNEINDALVDPDLMDAMAYFFDLYDATGCGHVDREGILKLIDEGVISRG